jgi:hypothetical protein
MLVKENRGKIRSERRGRRSKQLPNDLKEKRGYWKLKAEALVRTV